MYHAAGCPLPRILITLGSGGSATSPTQFKEWRPGLGGGDRRRRNDVPSSNMQTVPAGSADGLRRLASAWHTSVYGRRSGQPYVQSRVQSRAQPTARCLLGGVAGWPVEGRGITTTAPAEMCIRADQHHLLIGQLGRR